MSLSILLGSILCLTKKDKKIWAIKKF
jgi:hypothetical protein